VTYLEQQRLTARTGQTVVVLNPPWPNSNVLALVTEVRGAYVVGTTYGRKEDRTR
jgi:hypothetical protein